MSETLFDDTLHAIYDAALDPAGWEEALAATIRYVGGERGALGLSDFETGRADAMATWGLDPDLLARWHDEFDQQDPMTERAPLLEEGCVMSGREILSPAEFASYRVYQEIIAPLGIGEILTSVIARRPGRRAFVSVYRSPGSAPFEADEVERMARLVPHLQRAATLRTHLAEAEGRFLLDSVVLDRIRAALLVCDAERRVVRTNARAEALLEGSGPLVRREGRLACRRPAQERRLRVLVRRAVEGEAGGAPVAGALPLADCRDGPAIQAVVAPLRQAGDRDAAFAPAGTPGALVVVSEPDAPLQVPEGLLRDLHGLTPAEARLAASLAAGRTLQEHAEAEGIATGTARWRLKQVFAKTETHRQAELAALVLRSLALVDAAA